MGESRRPPVRGEGTGCGVVGAGFRFGGVVCGHFEGVWSTTKLDSRPFELCRSSDTTCSFIYALNVQESCLNNALGYHHDLLAPQRPTKTLTVGALTSCVPLASDSPREPSGQQPASAGADHGCSNGAVPPTRPPPATLVVPRRCSVHIVPKSFCANKTKRRREIKAGRLHIARVIAPVEVAS